MKPSKSLALVFLACVLAACGDEPTRPKLTPEQLASQFDSLAASIASAGSQDRSVALLNAAVAVRAGTEPTVITISEDGVADSYQALAVWFGADTFNIVGSTGGLKLVIPSHWGLVAWNGEPATGRLIAITTLGDSVSLGVIPPPYGEDENAIPLIPRFGLAMVVESGTTRLVAVNGTAVLSPGEPVAPCVNVNANVNGLASSRGDPLISRSDATLPIDCTLAPLDVRFDAEVEPTLDALPFYPDTTAPSRTLIMQPQTVDGIRFKHGR